MNLMRRKLRRPDRKGLTLIELMISLSVFGVIIAVVFGFMADARSSYQSTREKVQYQQSMRAVISLLTREVRSTGCDPTSAGFEPFAQAATNGLRCQMDLNGDGDTVDVGPSETVTYAFNAATGELVRSDGAAAMTILRGLNNFTFTYFDANGAVLGATPLSAVDRSLVRYVEVMLDGETDGGEPVAYTARIALRNG